MAIRDRGRLGLDELVAAPARARWALRC